MKLLKLTATFGCLDRDTLEFGPGMTLIGAPNGSGKSTWCAFLRTMLYGLDTRQRDKKGAPADKNRYRPWSGAPMEGLLVCEHEGRVIELRRTSRSGVPMGDFTALDRATGQPVDGLTAENAGEVLTGVSREVFDRSVFLRQTGLAVSQSQELEKRIAALVSSGEEDVSWSEADERLKTWQRRRKYRQTGQLPELEEEEARLRRKRTETASLRQELAQTQSKAASLRRQLSRWDRSGDREDHHQRFAQAEAELDAAEDQVHRLQDQLDQLDAPDQETMEEDVQEIQDDLKSRRRMMGLFVFLVVLLTIAAAAVYILPRYEIPFIPEAFTDIPLLPLFLSAGVAGGLWLLALLFSILKAIADHRDKKALNRLQTQWNSDKAGAYFSRLTGGQYEEVSLARDLSVTVRETGSLAGQPLSTVSQGTADQLYLALRLAVADLVLPYPGAAPLVLDDALLTFDDHRLDLALDCLTGLAGDRQVILFTCQHRELDRLEGMDNVITIRLDGF